MIFISGRILFKKVVLSSRYYHSQFHRHKGGEFHKIILCRTLQGKDLDGDSEYEQNRDQIWDRAILLKLSLILLEISLVNALKYLLRHPYGSRQQMLQLMIKINSQETVELWIQRICRFDRHNLLRYSKPSCTSCLIKIKHWCPKTWQGSEDRSKSRMWKNLDEFRIIQHHLNEHYYYQEISKCSFLVNSASITVLWGNGMDIFLDNFERQPPSPTKIQRKSVVGKQVICQSINTLVCNLLKCLRSENVDRILYVEHFCY